ncbi:hypothetical protein NM688_g1172 [Phlebia brevispora]|uniref:Uncharacterized protein n=1 Tax=Phlebia brevispora TaxID=194682 RepID=A0ACC1TC41_9APHY|nr:hypothetical protein NM688_g1172 [Phlebia brevispora]
MSSNCTLVVQLKHKSRRTQYNIHWVAVGESNNTTLPKGGNLSFTSRHRLHLGNSQVFKGTLKQGDRVYPKQVVCKLVKGDTNRTRAEAEFYVNHLKSVQGFLVPRFIGFFSGSSRNTEKSVSCLLLEYAGEALQHSWPYVPIDIRSKIMDELIRLHRMGIYHNDFRPENFVVDESGHPYMINFEEAELHECHVAQRKFRLFQVEPPRTDLECVEVCEASLEMDIWTPVRVAFHGAVIDIREVNTVERLAEIGMRSRPHALCTREQWMQRAEEFLRGYDQHYLKRRRDAKRAKEARKMVDDPAEKSMPNTELPSIQNSTLEEKHKESCGTTADAS